MKPKKKVVKKAVVKKEGNSITKSSVAAKKPVSRSSNEDVKTVQKADPPQKIPNIIDTKPARVTRSTTRSNVTATAAVAVTPKNVPKKTVAPDDEELMSLDGSSSSSESRSDDSDFILEDVNGSQMDNNKSNSVKKVVSAAAKNGTMKTKKLSKFHKIYSSSEASSSEGEKVEGVPSKKNIFKIHKKSNHIVQRKIIENKKPTESLRKLEDSSDDSNNEESSSSTPLQIKNSSTNLLHSRPVDYSFSKKENESVLKSSILKEEAERKLDIGRILAIGENRSQRISKEMSESSSSVAVDNSNVDSSDESSVDWEEIEDNGSQEHANENVYSVPAEGVVVTLPGQGPVFNRKKGKKEFDVADWIRKQTNQNLREHQELLHKTNLLCLLARGIMVNNWLRSEDLLAVALSILPSQQAYPPKHLNLTYLEKFLRWFKRTYGLEGKDLDIKANEFEENLKVQLLAKQCTTQENQVFIFIAILRCLGVDTRLMWSLQPLPLKAPSEILMKPVKPPVEENAEEKEIEPTTPSSSEKPSASKKKAPAKSKTKPKTQPKVKKSSRNIISDDEEDGQSVTVTAKPVKQGRDFWAEVYLEEEERWVSVDITTGKVLCDSEIEASSTQPLCYVLAFDNTGRVKDLTRRYATRWLTATQKIRVDSEWWDIGLKPFRGRRMARDKEEDRYLDQQLISQPLPKSIQECKGHPLFALRRHLLKFEAIYPMEANPLGFIKDDPIFSRECVKTLHTRELWTRKAKVVRMGETAYKVVKARPKYDRSSHQMIKDLPLELFGEWQVEDYIPPVAKDGKVPRNAYGNVELFDIDKMLPKGTVYLQLPGLNRVAKKLDIDCAPALTGFEFHMGCHPVFDGFVVCEEYKEILLDAWSQEQDEQKKRDEEKRRKRVYGNWAKLLKGLLIKRKLETKYSHMFTKRKAEDEPTTSANAEKRQKK